MNEKVVFRGEKSKLISALQQVFGGEDRVPYFKTFAIFTWRARDLTQS